MIPEHSDDFWSQFYDLCMVDDDCERGRNHAGPCGPKETD
jgi:hypothetical protein